MKPKAIFGLLKQTCDEWKEDKAARLGAALAYYTAFSIAPLLIITIAVVGLVFGQEAAQGQIFTQIRGLVGDEGARAIEDMIANAGRPSAGALATVVGVVTLALGAAGVMEQLKDALNTIWEVAPKPGRGILNLIKDRLFSFALVLGVGFLLLVSLVISAGLTAAGTFLGNALPGSEALWQAVNFAVSFGIVTLLFAMMYKLLPDVKIAWSDVWIGATVTALLFTIGKSLIGLYLGRSSLSSAYGAAGSFVVLLVWIYYSAQILFFGAEFTQVYANRYGSRVVTADDAVPLGDEARVQQGIPRLQQVEAAVAAASRPRTAIQPAKPPRRRGVGAAILGVVLGAIAGMIVGVVGVVVGLLRLVGGSGGGERAR